MCFYPKSEFDAFAGKGYQAGNATQAMQIGMFDCAVQQRFNGTKYPQLPRSGRAAHSKLTH
jgi:hypothetical protein